MILKESDGVHRDIDRLDALSRHPDADARIKLLIEEELRKLKAGDRGEMAAANHLRAFFGPTPNWVVINDLRLEHEGNSAQIDHLIINRTLDFWLCESKHARNGIKINHFGEFATFDNMGRPRGMASPVEQNERHVQLLRAVFDDGVVRMPYRLGIRLKPSYHMLVLIAQGAIARPRIPVPGIETVIKTEHLHKHVIDADASGNPFDLLKFVSAPVIHDIGRQLVALHRPATYNWARRLGLDENADPLPQPEQSAPQPPAVCDNCGCNVSPGTRRFCEKHADRFGGAILCLDCQPTVGRATA